MLMPHVQRRREEAARTPFEGLLALLVQPDGGGAAAADHVDELLKEMALRRGALARGDLADIRIVDAAGAFQIDEDAVHALSGPRLHRNRVEVFDEEATDARQALASLPLLVRRG